MVLKNWTFFSSRIHTCVQPWGGSSGQDELRKGREHLEIFHHLWLTGGLRTIRR